MLRKIYLYSVVFTYPVHVFTFAKSTRCMQGKAVISFFFYPIFLSCIINKYADVKRYEIHYDNDGIYAFKRQKNEFDVSLWETWFGKETANKTDWFGH